MKVQIIKGIFLFQLCLLTAVLASNKAMLEFECTGTKLVNSLRVLATYSQNSVCADEKISGIERQIGQVKDVYGNHSFILKGLNSILNNKVNILAREIQMETVGNDTFETETGKVTKGLNRAIKISPFKYIKKFKTVSTRKLESVLIKYDLVAKKGEELTDEQKKKKEVLARITRVVAATTVEASLAQGVVDLCMTVTTSLCLVSASIGGLGFLIWLTIIYQALT